ncbi:hypothetical protein Hanom_Chr06g00485651 [Helianthus anomalus]
MILLSVIGDLELYLLACWDYSTIPCQSPERFCNMFIDLTVAICWVLSIQMWVNCSQPCLLGGKSVAVSVISLVLRNQRMASICLQSQS